MKRILTLCFVAFLISFHAVKGQNDKIFAVPGNVINSWYFIKKNGKVAFTLPLGYDVVSANGLQNELMIQPPFHYNMYPFYNGVCIVRDAKRQYLLINEKGKTIKSFGTEVQEISPFNNGYALVKVQVPGKKGSWLYFINSEGEAEFGGKHFWVANNFSEGLALVQDNEGDDWRYIDTKGDTKLNLSTKHPDKNILWPNDFTHGLTKASWSEEGEYISGFFNKDGKIVLIGELTFKDRGYSYLASVANNRIAAKAPSSYKGSLYVVDNEGEMLATVENVVDFMPFQGEKAALTTLSKGENHKLYLMDMAGKVTNLKLPASIDMHTIRHFTSSYIIGYGIDSDVKKVGHFVVNFQGKVTKEIYSDLMDYGDNYYVTRLSNQSIKILKTSDDTPFWVSPKSEWVYNDLEDALKSPQDVISLLLKNVNDIDPRISELRNLRYLHIDGGNLASIPDSTIKSLEQLQKITFSHLSKMAQLPESLKDLRNLREIEINVMGEVNNLSSLIESMPNLKKVAIFNTNVPAGFEAKIKKTNPEIEVSVMNLDVEITVETIE